MDDFCVKFVIQVFEGVQVDRFVFVMMYGKFIYLVEIGLVFYYIGYILGMDKFIDLFNIIKNIKMNINMLLL